MNMATPASPRPPGVFSHLPDLVFGLFVVVFAFLAKVADFLAVFGINISETTRTLVIFGLAALFFIYPITRLKTGGWIDLIYEIARLRKGWLAAVCLALLIGEVAGLF